MHTLQKLLIKRLVEENGRSYSALTSGYDSEDNIAFHLKQLISSDFVEKRADAYFITVKGLNALNTFQKSDLKDDIFKKYFVGFVIKSGNKYLVKQHPNAVENYYNLPSGTPLFGERLEDALPRILFNETNISLSANEFKFDSFHLKTIRSSKGEVIFDDAFGVYKVGLPESIDLHISNPNYLWISEAELNTLENCWPEIRFCILRKDWEFYKCYDINCDCAIRE